MAAKKSKSGGRSQSKSTGIFSSMRGGMKGLVGQGGSKKKKPTTFWDVLFWILIIVFAAWVAYRQF